MGIAEFLTTSNCDIYENPKILQKFENKIKKFFLKMNFFIHKNKNIINKTQDQLRPKPKRPNILQRNNCNF